MNLQRLDIQAFGPYAKKTHIDFTAYERQIFLITGPTGAGKTMIFDAILYALFGESSTGERSGEALRSDYAESDLPTEVSLTFELRGKLYCITRSPQQMRPKARGSGLTKQPPKATLYFITSKDRSPIVGTSDVTAFITALLGVNAEQFRQLVLLPQGAFKAFLMSESKDKEDILRRLFDVNLYERITLKLGDYADQYREQIKHAEMAITQWTEPLKSLEIENLARHFAVANRDYASRYRDVKCSLEDVTGILQSAEIDWADAQKKVTAANTHYVNAQNVNQHIKLKAEILREQSKLLDKASEIAICQEKLDFYFTAKPLIDLLTKENQLIQLLSELETTCVTTKNELNVSEDRLEKTLTALNKLRDQCQIKASKRRIEERLVLQQLLPEIKRYFIYYDRQKNLLNAVEQAEAVYRDKAIAYHLNSAYQLAKDLKDHAPCPVCGSTKHPKLAVASSEATKDDVDAAQHMLHQAQTAYDKNQAHLNELKLHIESYSGESYPLTEDDINQRIAAIDLAENNYQDALYKADKAARNCENVHAKLQQKAAEQAKAAAAYKAELLAIKDQIVVQETSSQLDKKTAAEYDLADSEVVKLQAEITAYLTKKSSFEEELIRLEKLNLPEVLFDLAVLKTDVDNAIKKRDTLNKRLDGVRLKQQTLLQAERSICRHITVYQQAERAYRKYSTLASLAKGDNPQKLSLRRYILTAYMEDIIYLANQRLSALSDGRYQFCRSGMANHASKQAGLELDVFDNYTGVKRHVKTLSGGESFNAALALALGTSDMVSMRMGGVSMSTLLIDEGFGTLDEDALDKAIATLTKLSKNGRTVGIISHVAELKRVIPHKIIVKKDRVNTMVLQTTGDI